MKIKSLTLFLSFVILSGCSLLFEGQISMKENNELSQQRQGWSQFEEQRTQKELSTW